MNTSLPEGSESHEHRLRILQPDRGTKTILRSLLGGLGSSKPDVEKLSFLAGDSDLKGNYGVVSDKYGPCRQVIGSGGTSTVWLSESLTSDLPNKTLLAVKGFRRKSTGNEEDFKKRVRDEHSLLGSLRHPNILQSLELLQNEKGEIFEVLEFCAGGDLHSLLLERGKLDAAEADCFFKQLMTGVNYLHENGIAHRDLKPENIVLTEEAIVKIADFGDSERFRVGEMDVAMVGGVCGTSPYISPEAYTDIHFDPAAADIWSTGVIYMVMRLGRLLWHKAAVEDELYSRYVEDRRSENGYSPLERLGQEDRNVVVYSILDPKPSRRLRASQFLATQWAKRIQMCQATKN